MTRGIAGPIYLSSSLVYRDFVSWSRLVLTALEFRIQDFYDYFPVIIKITGYFLVSNLQLTIHTLPLPPVLMQSITLFLAFRRDCPDTYNNLWVTLCTWVLNEYSDFCWNHRIIQAFFFINIKFWKIAENKSKQKQYYSENRKWLS